MDRSDLLTAAFVVLMLALFASYIWRLVGFANDERRRREVQAGTTGKPNRHTWKDTLGIVVGLAAILGLTAAGVRDKAMIQILMATIAAWYAFRLWQDRRAAKKAEHDARTYRPYESI